MEEDDGPFPLTPPSFIPSTTKYTMTNSVVVLLFYLIPSANIRVLLLIVIIDYFVFLPHPPPSLASKKGLVTERFFYLTRPLLLGEVPPPS